MSTVEPITNRAIDMTKIAANDTNALRQNAVNPERTIRLNAIHIDQL